MKKNRTEISLRLTAHNTHRYIYIYIYNIAFNWPKFIQFRKWGYWIWYL